MNPIQVIAGLTLREAVRRRIALAAVILGGLFLVLYGLGVYFIYKEARPSVNAQALKEMLNFLTLAGLYATSFLCLAMGALLSADTLSGEINSGTIQTLVSKPVSRAQVVLGKWLGFALLLLAYEMLLAGGVIGIMYVQAQLVPHHVLRGVAFIYLESLIVMSTTLALSSRLSTLATGGVVFGLYGVSLIGGWVEQIGSMLQNQTAIDIGILTSFLFPAEAMWRRAAFEMTSPMMRIVGASPFYSNSVPSLAMIYYAGAFLLLMVALALRWFGKRDL